MPQTTNERIEAYFDKHARGYDREMGLFERFLLGHHRRWAASQAHGLVLEMAIGTGLNLPLYPEDARILGIDLSEQMLDQARARAQSAGMTDRVELLSGDMQSLDLPDASVDTVVSTYSVCTVPTRLWPFVRHTACYDPAGGWSLLSTDRRLDRGSSLDSAP